MPLSDLPAKLAESQVTPAEIPTVLPLLVSVREEIKALREEWSKQLGGPELAIITVIPAILISTKTRTIKFATLRACELFGYIAGELRGKHMNELIPERLRVKHDMYYEEFMKNPHPRIMGDYSVQPYGLCKDGTEIPIEIGLEPVMFEGEYCMTLTIIRTRAVSRSTPMLAHESTVGPSSAT